MGRRIRRRDWIPDAFELVFDLGIGDHWIGWLIALFVFLALLLYQTLRGSNSAF
jgi:hypothetical protein